MSGPDIYELELKNRTSEKGEVGAVVGEGEDEKAEDYIGH